MDSGAAKIAAAVVALALMIGIVALFGTTQWNAYNLPLEVRNPRP